jgi:hypothetical protein
MKAYLVAVAYYDELTNSPVATSAIIISPTSDHSTLLQQMLPIIAANVNLYDVQIAELQTDVLIALAKHTKEKGLI